jgi:hypothetical protein
MMVDNEKPYETFIETHLKISRIQQFFEYLLVNLYKVFYFLGSSQYSDQRLDGVRTKYYAHFAYMIIYTMQLIGLALPANQIQASKDFEGFFYFVLMFRLDFAAVWLGVGNGFYILILSLISIITLSLIKLYTNFIRGRPSIIRYYKLFLVWPSSLLQNYIFIPCLAILISVYKHSSDSK